MFDSRDAGFSLGQNRSTLCVNNVLSYGIDDGFTFKVDALNLISCVLGSRIECDSQI